MAEAVAVPTGTGDVTIQAVGSSGLRTLYGYSLAEDAGTPAAATVILRDANDVDTTGTVVAVIELASSGSETVFFPGGGLILRRGLRVDRTAGSCFGAVYLG